MQQDTRPLCGIYAARPDQNRHRRYFVQKCAAAAVLAEPGRRKLCELREFIYQERWHQNRDPLPLLLRMLREHAPRQARMFYIPRRTGQAKCRRGVPHQRFAHLPRRAKVRFALLLGVLAVAGTGVRGSVRRQNRAYRCRCAIPFTATLPHPGSRSRHRKQGVPLPEIRTFTPGRNFP